MTMKAVHISDVPNQHDHNSAAAFSFCSPSLSHGGEAKVSKFVVGGHRGSGINMPQSSDPRMKFLKENSILSFNTAAQLNLDFIEFDVQVTKDDCPVFFHDIFILTEQQGTIIKKRATDLTLADFLSYGPQREPGKEGKPLYRKTKDGRIFEWKVENDDPLCTLEEVFQKVDRSLGFDIELKFDDHKAYEEEELKHILQVILKVVNKHAEDRPIIFSSFQPDAAQLIRKLQHSYPVFLLTNGGCEIFADTRRNSLDEAIKLCFESGLEGIVSQVQAIFRNPGMVTKIKDAKLSLITYGQLNNVPEAVYMQHLMGVDGVVLDFVHEIKEAVSEFLKPAKVIGDKDAVKENGNEGKQRRLHYQSMSCPSCKSLFQNLYT